MFNFLASSIRCLIILIPLPFFLNFSANLIDLNSPCSLFRNFKAPHPINSSFSHKLQNLIDESLRPFMSRTCALPSGETDLNSIKCFFNNSSTLGLSKFPSIDFFLIFLLVVLFVQF